VEAVAGLKEKRKKVCQTIDQWVKEYGLNQTLCIQLEHVRCHLDKYLDEFVTQSIIMSQSLADKIQDCVATKPDCVAADDPFIDL
jgi:hypothetical protein